MSNLPWILVASSANNFPTCAIERFGQSSIHVVNLGERTKRMKSFCRGWEMPWPSPSTPLSCLKWKKTHNFTEIKWQRLLWYIKPVTRDPSYRSCVKLSGRPFETQDCCVHLSQDMKGTRRGSAGADVSCARGIYGYWNVLRSLRRIRKERHRESSLQRNSEMFRGVVGKA